MTKCWIAAMRTMPIGLVVADLERYAKLEGTEWGETTFALINLWNARTLLKDEFVAILETEIREWYKDIKQNAAIVERPETTTVMVEELVWRD